MRTIKRTSQFKKDYKREMKGRNGLSLKQDLVRTLNFLVNDILLPVRYTDHPLKGNWEDHRDCHLKPDLILIYRKPDAETIELVRLGSHSELGIG